MNDEPVDLAQPRTSPYPKAEVINLNDAAQVRKLRGRGILVVGAHVVAAAMVNALRMHGVDAVLSAEGGGKTYDVPDSWKKTGPVTVGELMPLHRKLKEKAQWKRERSGRR